MSAGKPVMLAAPATHMIVVSRTADAGLRSSVTNLVEKAGVPFDHIISGWLIANYTDNVAVSGLDGRYTCTACGWTNPWWEGHSSLPTAEDDPDYPGPGKTQARRSA